MKRLTLVIALIAVFIVTATASASGPDALKSPLPTMTPPDAHHFTAHTMPDAWYRLRAVPLTAEDWRALDR